jgi:hypothetical protein
MKRILLLLFLGLFLLTGCRKETVSTPDITPSGVVDPQFFMNANFGGETISFRAGEKKYSTQPLSIHGPGVFYGDKADEDLFKTTSLFDFATNEVKPGYHVFVSFALPNPDDIRVKDYQIAWPGFIGGGAGISVGKVAIQVSKIEQDLNITGWFTYTPDNYANNGVVKVTRVEDYTFKAARRRKVHFTFDCNIYDLFSSQAQTPVKRLTGEAVMLF